MLSIIITLLLHFLVDPKFQKTELFLVYLLLSNHYLTSIKVIHEKNPDTESPYSSIYFLLYR